MKNWKKNIGFAVVFVLLAGFASSCSNNSGKSTSSDDDSEPTHLTESTPAAKAKWVGTWKMTKLVQGGTVITPTPPITYVFTTGGTYTETQPSETKNGTYFVNETKFTLKPTGDDPSTSPYRMTTSNTKIVIEVPDGSGGTNITEYTKQ